MPFIAHAITLSGPRSRRATRPLAIGALLGATILAGALTAANAQPAAAPQNPAAAGAAAPKSDTVEQRIKSLHAQLKITPDEETKWNAVAQAMRDNAAEMDKVAAANEAAQNVSAVDDLKMYQKYAQAHVDGLKNLISSFSTLYDSMPDAQKKRADEVFEARHQASVASHRQAG